ncbi:hypothetical protein TRFO_42154 [Tritrichomonas foetus]|uniref:Uncharacterized protein n=1 Tax=Tritrichomonas foetus TaxID=1144522 RepID=A0A1J4KYN2_9EUKA|nr:hypothetical protein TRFO_42154 [Tritrichomonas foetus]|eukprot:OHT15984.1 hypothetical protein TRFO_42154 [Tritrichomonas foetus]
MNDNDTIFISNLQFEMNSVSLFDDYLSNDEKMNQILAVLERRNLVLRNVKQSCLENENLSMCTSLQFIDMIGLELTRQRLNILNDIFSHKTCVIERKLQNMIHNNIIQRQGIICTINLEQQFDIEEIFHEMRQQNFDYEILNICNQTNLKDQILWMTFSSLATNGFLFVPTIWEKNV